MAWTAPMTAVANTVFTAAQFNTHVRDNLLETAPAKASTVSGYFVATGTNAIAQRVAQTASNTTDTGTTTSTTYTSTLTSGGTNPAITVTTGERALICLSVDMENTTATSGFTHMAYSVGGATTLSSSDNFSAYFETITAIQSLRATYSHVHVRTGLTPGSNIFTLQYKTSSGTASYQRRHISVIPF